MIDKKGLQHTHTHTHTHTHLTVMSSESEDVKSQIRGEVSAENPTDLEAEQETAKLTQKAAMFLSKNVNIEESFSQTFKDLNVHLDEIKEEIIEEEEIRKKLQELENTLKTNGDSYATTVLRMKTAQENMDKINDDMKSVDATLRALVTDNDSAVVRITKSRDDFNQTLVHQANNIRVVYDSTIAKGSQTQDVYENLKKFMTEKQKWKTNVHDAATAALLS